MEEVFDQHVADGMSFVAGNLRELMRVKPEQQLGKHRGPVNEVFLSF